MKQWCVEHGRVDELHHCPFHSPEAILEFPVWACQNPDCRKLYRDPPDPTRSIRILGRTKYHVSPVYCDECGGDVVRDLTRIPLAKGVRPLPKLKGQREYSMWRWCCYGCGQGHDVAHGFRRTWRTIFSGGYSDRRLDWSVERCVPCGRENRVVYP